MPDPTKKIINNPAASLYPPKNRKQVITTTVRGSDARGNYTDTNTNQAADMYPGSGPSRQRPVNAWFNSLTPAQKQAHNAAQRAKQAINVPGAATTSRVYDPSTKTNIAAPPSLPPPVAKRYWTAAGVPMTFGGHTDIGTSTDPAAMLAGFEKNRVDRMTPQGVNNTYETRAFTDKENILWDNRKINVESNPIGKDTTGRGARHDKLLFAMEQAKIKTQNRFANRPVRMKASGGTMTYKTAPVVVSKKGSKLSSGCGCGDDKMQQGGPVESSSYQTAKGSVMGATSSMIKQSKDKKSMEDMKKKPAGQSSSSVPRFGMGTKKVMQQGGEVSSDKFKSKVAMGKPKQSYQESKYNNAKSRSEEAKQGKPGYSPGKSASVKMAQDGKQVGHRRTMYADGGNIPQIDEESPIRYRR